LEIKNDGEKFLFFNYTFALSLSLFVFWTSLTDNKNTPSSTNDFTLFTHRFYGWTNFHDFCSQAHKISN